MTPREPLPDRLARVATNAARNFHRLVLLVGPAGCGKTTALRALGCQPGYHYLNLGIDLGRLLLDLSERQRRLQLPALLDTLCAARTSGEVVLLDNLELLFARSLAQEPLRLLERMSRNGILVAAWRGAIVDGALCYASPDHPEHRREPFGNHLVVLVDEAATS